jgi:hypothetical protein
MKLKDIFLFFMLFVCTTIFWSSFHNVDLAWNAERGMIDSNGIVTQDVDTMYQNGMMWMMLSFCVAMLSVFVYLLVEGELTWIQTKR